MKKYLEAINLRDKRIKLSMKDYKKYITEDGHFGCHCCHGTGKIPKSVMLPDGEKIMLS